MTPFKFHGNVLPESAPCVARQFHSVLMAKNESDGRTVMMIAAAADIPEVLEAFFSRLTQAQVSARPAWSFFTLICKLR